MKVYIDKKYLKKVFETPSDSSYWFGYYNYDPLNIDSNKVLCNKIDFDGRSINSNDKIELGWFDINKNSWNTIGYTDSFNWQQGAMLQWLPNNKNEVIYNVTKNNKFKSIIFNIETHLSKELDFPIYAVFPSGNKALCLNYERSYWCRAYHYQTIKNNKYDVRVADDDGIFELTFETNSLKRIISIGDVINFKHNPAFDKASHWLEHIMINKEGTKGVVLHRYSLGDVMNYFTRIVAFNCDGTNLVTVDNANNLQWSHIGWLSENEFVAYSIAPSPKGSSTKKAFKRGSFLYTIARKIYYGIIRHFLSKKSREKYQATGSYRLYQINDKSIIEIDKLPNIGEIDGHPSFTNNHLFMITDTYPDSKGIQHLYIYSIKTHKRIEVGRFNAFYRKNPASCDLHPKLSRDDKFLMVDSAYDDKHHFMVFEINWEQIIKDAS